MIITKIDFVNLNENMNRELEKICLKYSTISETLIRDAIANDPKMLEVIDNIKNLVLVDKERVQHKKIDLKLTIQQCWTKRVLTLKRED